MCRYAFKLYKPHFACFDCRKVFRKPFPRITRWTPNEKVHGLHGHPYHFPNNCPDCGQPMHDMGLDFRAPKQTDLKRWQAVTMLHRHGITFHNCGCGAGYRPDKPSEVEAFVAAERRRRSGSSDRRYAAKRVRREVRSRRA